MKRPIVITDLTRMREPNVCIAGYTREWECVRPVVPFRGIPEWFLRKDDCLIFRPFAVVELDFVRAAPQPPHTEDWEIDRLYRSPVMAQVPEERKLAILERTATDSVAGMFGADIHDDNGFYVKTGEGQRSLGTIRPARFIRLFYQLKEGDKWDYRIAFQDGAGKTYRLAVTDLAYRCFLDYQRGQPGFAAGVFMSRQLCHFNERTTFLRIGLARNWEQHPDRCYLQITGIYTFPDYLEGRCFTDFDH